MHDRDEQYEKEETSHDVQFFLVKVPGPSPHHLIIDIDFAKVVLSVPQPVNRSLRRQPVIVTRSQSGWRKPASDSHDHLDSAGCIREPVKHRVSLQFLTLPLVHDMSRLTFLKSMLHELTLTHPLAVVIGFIKYTSR